MIYLDKTEQAQVLFIPKHRQATGKLVFRCKSSINQQAWEKTVIDLQTSTYYHRISFIVPSEAPRGEYQYILSDDEGVLSNGILIIGENQKVIQYEKSTEYKQYE